MNYEVHLYYCNNVYFSCSTITTIKTKQNKTFMYFKWNEYIYDDCAQIKVQNSMQNHKLPGKKMNERTNVQFYLQYDNWFSIKNKTRERITNLTIWDLCWCCVKTLKMKKYSTFYHFSFLYFHFFSIQIKFSKLISSQVHSIHNVYITVFKLNINVLTAIFNAINFAKPICILQCTCWKVIIYLFCSIFLCACVECASTNQCY